MSWGAPKKLEDGSWYVPAETMKIIEMYEKGYPYLHIGMLLKLSKSSVTGRIDRLRKGGYPFTIKAEDRNSRPGPRKRVLDAPEAFKPGVLPVLEKEKDLEEKKLLITDLGPRQCRYSVTKHSPFYFCGGRTPKSGISWCVRHYRRVYGKDYAG